ncbi:MAG: SpoIIE family protein phosphatase, partial [Leptospiraceae bacterium]|nr:SpoIIE family protein phosphatase [Leptospiraceae bacterium]
QLRIQQDGYYFLTSLLAKPLYFNANKSKQVKTEFIIRQKNSFVFKDKRAELGGDICLTGNLKFGKKSKHTSFTFALNADAMGKSVQGAGGAMVLGVVVNAMLSRSASNKRILDISPRTWLEEFFNELNLVYKTFDGYLLATACMFLINDETGECLYINAGHPRTVLLRNEKANFIETSIEHTKKIGLDLNASDLIKSFKLKDKDILILGSDGKDHINLSPGKAQTRINEKEDLFLRLVEKANGKLFELEQNIFLTGEVTDDFSLLRLEFTVPKDSSGLTRQEIFFGEESSSREEFFFGEDDFSEKEDISVVSEMYTQGRKLYQEGNVKKAIEVLSKAFKKDDKNQKLNKLFGLACFKDKQYEIAIRVISQYLKQDPDNTEMWYYMSLAQRKVGQYVQSIDSAKKFYEKFPDNVQNLINLSDLYRIEGNFKKAEHFSKLALKIDPENKNAKKILEVLENVA